MLNRLNHLRNKRGFGIIEVMVAAIVLGFMYLALLNLQLGNREALLRIRGRDGAVEVAQQVIDSLRTVGVAGITDCVIDESDEDKSCSIPVERSWGRGKFAGGESATNVATIKYTAQVKIQGDAGDYTAVAKSQYEDVSHVYAKRVLVTVSWKFKNSNPSIDIEGVIR